jgi:hypothetical protein
LVEAKRCRDAISDLQAWIWPREPKRVGPQQFVDPKREPWVAARNAIDEAWRAADGLCSVLDSGIAEADSSRFIFAVGPAGAGKSHLLADWASKQVEQSKPVILLLGIQLDRRDLFHQIKERLDVASYANAEFLGALDAAAEAADERCVIVINGINEGAGALIWNSAAPSFL